MPSTPSYRGFRFPPEIISHTVALYFRFSLSYRDVEELLAERGVTVTHETVGPKEAGRYHALAGCWPPGD